jgi:hypothetical protein
MRKGKPREVEREFESSREFERESSRERVQEREKENSREFERKIDHSQFNHMGEGQAGRPHIIVHLPRSRSHSTTAT